MRADPGAGSGGGAVQLLVFDALKVRLIGLTAAPDNVRCLIRS